MIYAGILAGGSGLRMGGGQMPKQFMMLGGKPVFIHTVEKFLCVAGIHDIYLGVLPDWIPQCRDLLARYLGPDHRVKPVAGGADRNGTIMNIISAIRLEYGVNEGDVIVTHDAVRPFVTGRIIEENISAALEYGACDTVIKCSDTIVNSADGQFISSIPDRREMYSGQTPQSFEINTLTQHYESLTPDEKAVLTDACKICVLKGQPVHLVEGDIYNFKITTRYDLKMAQAMLDGASDAK